MNTKKQNSQDLVVLHVEDNEANGTLVSFIFQQIGFSGTLLRAWNVREAVQLLAERAQNKQPIHLFLLDMQLGDGTGLDIIRMAKNNPHWHLTPMILLSSETNPEQIAAGYAAGAACFFPKDNLFAAIESLTSCWLEHGTLPQASPKNALQAVVARSSYLRSRVANFYFGVAETAEPTETGFWLDRALNEGNLSHLLAFLEPMLGEENPPLDLVDLMAPMQDKLESLLSDLEIAQSTKAKFDIAELCHVVMKLHAVLNEEVIGDIIKYLFTITPVTMKLFKKHAAGQLAAIADFTLQRTQDDELRIEAQGLQAWAQRLVGNAK